MVVRHIFRRSTIDAATVGPAMVLFLTLLFSRSWDLIDAGEVPLVLHQHSTPQQQQRRRWWSSSGRGIIGRVSEQRKQHPLQEQQQQWLTERLQRRTSELARLRIQYKQLHRAAQEQQQGSAMALERAAIETEQMLLQVRRLEMELSTMRTVKEKSDAALRVEQQRVQDLVEQLQTLSHDSEAKLKEQHDRIGKEMRQAVEKEMGHKFHHRMVEVEKHANAAQSKAVQMAIEQCRTEAANELDAVRARLEADVETQKHRMRKLVQVLADREKQQQQQKHDRRVVEESSSSSLSTTSMSKALAPGKKKRKKKKGSSNHDGEGNQSAGSQRV
jgi:hypothetical protein